MLFVYGTLQDPDILAAALGRPVDVAALRPASAPGFRAVGYPGRVYPALVAAPGEAAPGRVVTGLDALDLAVLDAFEGDEYRRAGLSVSLEGRLQPADGYLPVLPIAAGLPQWELTEWTRLHKPSVIAAETGTAAALRQRLAAVMPG